MITIYLIGRNEEKQIDFTIRFYKHRLPSAHIILYDNFSTDKTVAIAKSHGCIVRQFDTLEQMDDAALIHLKNNCWKTATTKWVLICDVDECIDVWERDLIVSNASILRSRLIDIVGRTNTPYKACLAVYYPELLSNKYLCFDRTRVEEINYLYGAHKAMPYGDISYSLLRYPFYHYRWLGIECVLEKSHNYAKRLSSNNIRKKLSYHYKFSDRKLKRIYKNMLKQSQLIKPPAIL